MTKIGLIGAGSMAVALATLLAQAGHGVRLSGRAGKGERQGFAVGSFESIAEWGEIIVIAIPHDGLPELLPKIRPALKGKIVMDCSNPFAIHNGFIVNPLPDGETEGQWMARHLPQSHVVRAFSHLQDELIVSRATRQPDLWAIAIAGDDDTAVEQIGELVTEMRYVPVMIGTLAQSAALDPGGALFVKMTLPMEMKKIAGLKA